MIKWIIFLFLFCAACGNPQINQEAQLIDAHQSAIDESIEPEMSADIQNCGKLNYPKFIDVDNQLDIQNQIENGSAKIIVHFKELNQQAIDEYLQKNGGILEVGPQWPDWGAVAVTVDPAGLDATMRDCTIRVIESDKQEFPQ